MLGAKMLGIILFLLLACIDGMPISSRVGSDIDEDDKPNIKLEGIELNGEKSQSDLVIAEPATGRMGGKRENVSEVAQVIDVAEHSGEKEEAEEESEGSASGKKPPKVEVGDKRDEFERGLIEDNTTTDAHSKSKLTNQNKEISEHGGGSNNEDSANKKDQGKHVQTNADDEDDLTGKMVAEKENKAEANEVNEEGLEETESGSAENKDSTKSGKRKRKRKGEHGQASNNEDSTNDKDQSNDNYYDNDDDDDDDDDDDESSPMGYVGREIRTPDGSHASTDNGTSSKAKSMLQVDDGENSAASGLEDKDVLSLPDEDSKIREYFTSNDRNKDNGKSTKRCCQRKPLNKRDDVGQAWWNCECAKGKKADRNDAECSGHEQECCHGKNNADTADNAEWERHQQQCCYGKNNADNADNAEWERHEQQCCHGKNNADNAGNAEWESRKVNELNHNCAHGGHSSCRCCEGEGRTNEHKERVEGERGACSWKNRDCKHCVDIGSIPPDNAPTCCM